MIWAHAGRLHDIFLRVGAVPGETAELFNRTSSRMTKDIFDRDPDYWNDVLHPQRVNRPIFLVHAIAQMLTRIGPVESSYNSIASRIRDVAVQTVGEQSVPNSLLMRDSLLASDSLGSFLGGDRWAILEPVLEADFCRQFSSPKLRSIAETSIVSLISDPNAGVEWLKLVLVVGDLPVYPELIDKVKLLFERIELSTLLDRDPKALELALLFVSSQARHVLDDNGQSRLLDQLLKLGEMLSTLIAKESHSTPASELLAKRNVAGSLLDSLVTLSICAGNPRSTSRRFSDSLKRLYDMAPDVFLIFRHALERLVLELPVSQLHGIWPIVLLARARSREG